MASTDMEQMRGRLVKNNPGKYSFQERLRRVVLCRVWNDWELIRLLTRGGGTFWKSFWLCRPPTLCLKYSTPSYIDNFVDSQRIFKILSLAHSADNLRQTYNYRSHHPKTRVLRNTNDVFCVRWTSVAELCTTRDLAYMACSNCGDIHYSAVNERGRIICDFQPMSRLISEIRKESAKITINHY